MEKRDQIIEAASKLIGRYGAKRLTMDDVCRALSISKKTLYEYFSDKDTLILEYVQNLFRDLDKILDDLSHAIKNPKERLAMIDRRIVEEVLNYNPGIIEDLRRYYKKPHEIRLVYREHLLERLQGILEEGQKKGVFRKELNARLLTEYRLREIESLWSRHTFVNGPALQQEQDQLFEVFLKGISV